MKANDYSDACAQFLKRLVQTPSVNGRDDESAVVKVIAAEAEKLGLPYRIIAKNERRPNIFVGTDFKGIDGLLLVAHLDTVPEGSITAWKHNPFDGAIQDTRLYGRGAVDCKGGIAISLYAMKLLADQGKIHLAKFVGVADEESGADSALGLRYLLDEGLGAKSAVYAYGGGSGQETLTIGHRGVIRLWVTCHGEGVHSGGKEWQNRLHGENAIDGITALIEELKQFDAPGKSEYFPGYRFIMTPTMIEGGNGESIVPDYAKILLDIRTLPEHNNQEIIASITSLTKKLSAGKRSYTVAVKNNIPGALTEPNSDIVKRALRLNKEIFGVTSRLSGSGPANEGYMLIGAGIPTIMGYGPDGDNYHSANEYAQLESISPLLKLVTKLAAG